MAVVTTDKWLQKDVSLTSIAEKLKSYFSDLSTDEIIDLLHFYGMYKSERGIREIVEELVKNNVWNYVKEDEHFLKKLWHSPDIPIFIFPCDLKNIKIMREYGGKAGVAFRDKLFLFFSPMCSKQDVQALFTHEYNHIARLAADHKKNYQLSDTVVLEGIAENAVRERFGEEGVSKWTSYYTEQEAYELFKRYILPNSELTRDSKRYAALMFGKGFVPKMLGYCVGYHIVKNYLDQNRVTTKELLNKPSKEIIDFYQSKNR
jgi:uncharacterized protein YjaZ